VKSPASINCNVQILIVLVAHGSNVNSLECELKC
jgi:hypothetical protein